MSFTKIWWDELAGELREEFFTRDQVFKPSPPLSQAMAQLQQRAQEQMDELLGVKAAYAASRPQRTGAEVLAGMAAFQARMLEALDPPPAREPSGRAVQYSLDRRTIASCLEIADRRPLHWPHFVACASSE